MTANNRQRYHFSWILFKLMSLIKGSFFIFLYLFILKSGSTSPFWLTIKGVFIAAIIFSLVKIFLDWIYTRYEITAKTIILYHGVFVKKQRNVAIKRIQNMHQATNFLHRLLKQTSLTLETGTTGEDASVKFPVLVYKEAERIKEIVEESKVHKTVLDNLPPEETEYIKETSLPLSSRQVYFTAAKKDLVKAAFTSLSIFAIFPILFSLYYQIDDYFSLDSRSQPIFNYLLAHLWLLVPIFIVALLISAGIGFLTTYFRYGNFIISADDHRIYIQKGVFTETHFSIQKDKVQAIKFEQNFLKRVLGMVEVKLISAGNVGEESAETNSLFPFLSVKDAGQLVEQLLPSYEIPAAMQGLPRKVLWLRLLRPYYFWLIATAGLFFFKREWILLSAVLFALIVIGRILDFYYTRYAIDERFVQIRKGAFNTETFLTKRVKIQEVELTHGWLQRKFGVSSISFNNRGQPLYISKLTDVPRETSSQFYGWYKERAGKVK